MLFNFANFSEINLFLLSFTSVPSFSLLLSSPLVGSLNCGLY
ncbi:MAG: hypothetical protein ACTS6G_01260 [Candidatus Hodgkinia cicadicola]